MASSPHTAPWPAFRAFAQTFIPETAAAAETDWQILETVVRNTLASRPARVRRQILVFARLIDLTARVRHQRGFAALDGAPAAALLQRFATSRVLAFRRGIWGLRTLVMMGWYTNPSVATSLGYRATAAGWAARR